MPDQQQVPPRPGSQANGHLSLASRPKARCLNSRDRVSPSISKDRPGRNVVRRVPTRRSWAGRPFPICVNLCNLRTPSPRYGNVFGRNLPHFGLGPSILHQKERWNRANGDCAVSLCAIARLEQSPFDRPRVTAPAKQGDDVRRRLHARQATPWACRRRPRRARACC